MNLIEQIKVNDVSIDGYQGTYYSENPEWARVILDSDEKVLAGIKADGTVEWGAGVPTPIREYVEEQLDQKVDKEDGKSLIDAEYAEGVSQIENPEFAELHTDADDKILYGVRQDGDFYFGSGVPSQVQEELDKVAEVVANKVDKEEGKSLIDTDYASTKSSIENPEFMKVELDADDKVLSGRKVNGTKFENNDVELSGNATVGGSLEVDGVVIKNIEDPEDRHEITLDAEEKIVSYRKEDGTLVENVGIESPKITTDSLSLSESGMTDFQQALKDSGFEPGGGGDYSDTITEKGKKPVFIPMPHLARLNIHWDGDLTALSKSDRQDGVQKVNYDVKVKCDFFDGQGVYFSKWALMSAQGNSSMEFKEKNLSLKFFDTENVENAKGKWGKGDTFGTVFGDWVMQKTYHLKAYYTDFLKGSAVVAYQLANEVYKTRGIYADRPWKKALIDFSKIHSSTPAGLLEDGINDINLQIDNGARCMPDGFPVIVYQNGEFYGIFCWQLKKDSDNFNLDTSNADNVHIDGNLTVQYLWDGTVDWTQFEIRNPEDLVCMDGSDYDGDFPQELIDDTSEHWDSTDKNHVRSAKVKQHIQNLANRVGEINAMTPTYTRPDDAVITLNTYKDAYDATVSYARGNWVKASQNDDTYYMSLRNNNSGHALSDTDYWHDITSEIAQIKSTFETYFDVDNMVDYQLINMAIGDTDGFSKNWQWVTYDGTKWYVNQYDKDMAFGNYWTGMYTTAPRTGWINSTTNLPSGIAIMYYTPEHKERWNDLVGEGLFTADHIKKLISDWVARIGKANYEQNWKKWTEAPCNRDSNIDFDNWEFTGGSINRTPTDGILVWDDETVYNVDDIVWFKIADGKWHLKFKAVQQNSNKPCLMDYYTDYPKSMGYRDSVWRFYRYVDETISNQNTFINSLN